MTERTMTHEEYRAAPGLSHSMLRQLAVSPLRLWARCIDPNREKEVPTPEMEFGSALHCKVLEAAEFDKRYACAISAEDYPGCLVTMEDLAGRKSTAFSRRARARRKSSRSYSAPIPRCRSST